ncbi:MAG: hypothetical protein JWL90_4169 [Chthoniobacteraceae bacterium]|nr:hypothetical protein [Chthoniobacteraceae bacterium]
MKLLPHQTDSFPFARTYFIFAILLWCTAAMGQTINPADYGNVTLHLKADTLTQANNTAVTAWGPMSASGTAAPTYIASDARFNNKPVVRFDGNSDVLKWSTPGLGAQTIFAVVTMENAAGSLAGLISTGDDKLNVRRADATSFYRCAGRGFDTNDLVGVAPTGNLYVNNVASGGFTPGVAHLMMAVAGSQKSYAPFWIGSASSALGRYWNGSVAEIIVFDGTLTQLGLERVGWYLQNKYSLPTNFPAPLPVISKFTAGGGGLVSSTGLLSTAGAPVTLSWEVNGATSLSIDNGAQASTDIVSGTVTVNPTVTTTYTLTALNGVGPGTRSVTVHIGLSPQPARINEFVADNGGTLKDEDGDSSDWIEIFNPNPFVIDLAGYRLQDGSAIWTFPAGAAIEANGYRIVFASQKNRVNPAANLHTNFSLDADGEFLALSLPDGTVATAFSPAYPPQRKGASGGAGATPVYFEIPTPGAANGAAISGFVSDTIFSVKRGFFTVPFQVAITTPTAGATIRYTLDGSTPSATTGFAYSTPLTIGASTTLRARAFLANYAPTNTDTETYLFLADILKQSNSPAGWPASGVNGQLLRYGWNATLKAQYTNQQLLDALRQIPSISIVTDQANLTSAATGIYVNALEKSDVWERPASVELLQPDGSAGFHVNAGLRIRGGYSRNAQYAKHSLRLYFRSGYGDSKLKFPLHGVSGTDSFQTLDLRSEQNYHWANDAGTQNTAVREVFCRDLMSALGQPSTRTRYIHLYINGQYWGLYETEERAQEDYGATYFGGSSDDFDVIQTSNHPDFTYEVSSGTVNAWRTLWTLARAHAASPNNTNYFLIFGRDASGQRNPAFPVYLELDNLISYMLLHYYTGDGDGPLSNFLSMNQANNWRGMRSRVNGEGFRFFVHDAEHTLQASSWVDNRPNTNAPNGSNRGNFTYSNPEWIHEDLSANPEYRIRFADLAQKFLFNNGPMTPAAAQKLFDARPTQISQAIITDAARWGTSATNHTLAQWQSRLNSIRASFFPTRHTALIGYLRTRGFFPTANAPTFSQRGGQVADGYKLTLGANQAGTIYYTLDGSDPRAIGGAPVGTVYTAPGIPINGPVNVRARFRDTNGVWSALDESYFSTLTLAAPGKLVVKKLHYHALDPTQAEVAAGYNSEAAFEYIELQNISSDTLDLRGVSFTDGITFQFTGSLIQSLAPGASLIVVGNVTAFTSRYGGGLPVAGAFAGDLKNSGEFIRLATANNTTIFEFTYSDSAPWPVQADGQGFALVIRNPAANPDPNLAASWRGSYAPGGKPAGVDQIGISDWRALYFSATDLSTPDKEATLWGNAADADSDGVSNLTEFVLGSSPVNAQSRPNPMTSAWTDPATSLSYLRLTCAVTEGVVGVSFSAESSGDLVTWQTGISQSGPAVSNGDGTALVTFQDTVPINGHRFMRLRVESN